MQNTRWLLGLITRVHRGLYRVSGGRLGNRLKGHPMLLLETVGRKSGQKRVTPLLYVPDGERWLIVASNAGDDRYPAWWFNLEAESRASIQVGRERHDVRAHTADPAERSELWPRVVAAYPDYDEYQTRTERPIPVVVLERSG